MSGPSKMLLYREMGKDLCPRTIQPFLEDIDRRSPNNANQKFIPVFDATHRKGHSSPPVMDVTLENILGVPS